MKVPETMFRDAGPKSPLRSVVDLLAMLTPAAIWFLHLNISYLLVPPSCRADQRWPLAAVTVIALAVISIPARRSLRTFRGAQRGDLSWFVGLAGVAMAALFALVTSMVGASALLVDPCR